MNLLKSFSSNGNAQHAEDEPAVTPANQLVITLNGNGSVSVTGPIMNKILCYGLLEGAKQVIATYTPAKVS